MRALIPVACVAGFGLFVRYSWAQVHDAITRSTSNSPYLHTPPPTFERARPPVVEEEPIEDDRVFDPGEVLPPPARPPRRTHYADPHTPPPPTRVHPAERVMKTP